MPAPNSSSPSSPGIAGALKDAIAALADAVAPRSVTQRKPKIDQTVDDGQHSDEYLARARRGQSTDAANGQ